MNINKLTYANYNFNTSFKKEKSMLNNYATSVNFKAVASINPKLVSQSSIKVLDKFRKFPQNSKLPEGRALFFEVNGQKYGMKVDKFDKNKTSFIVKNMVSADDNWDKLKLDQSTLKCIFDENGVMVYGELMKKRNENYTNRFIFDPIKKVTRRRILHEGTFLRPTKNNIEQDVWNCIDCSSGHRNLGEVNLKKEYADIDFSELFFELAKPNVSVL